MAISTTYGDGVTTSTSVSPYSTQGQYDDLFQMAAARRMGPAPPPVRPGLGGGGAPRLPTYSGGQEKAPTGMPGQKTNRGKPVFTKTVGGAGIVPGTIRLNQWEPGAAFAGYTDDLGEGPANATVGVTPGEASDAEARRRALNDQDFANFQRSSGANPRGMA